MSRFVGLRDQPLQLIFVRTESVPALVKHRQQQYAFPELPAAGLQVRATSAGCDSGQTWVRWTSCAVAYILTRPDDADGTENANADVWSYAFPVTTPTEPCIEWIITALSRHTWRSPRNTLH